jgi:6-pyruvoyltetrahydropterin/6-carboxytetrahydropterin synthase
MIIITSLAKESYLINLQFRTICCLKTQAKYLLQITKVFHFEMAHALHKYQGHCKNIHGHSYQLHVTVRQVNASNEYIKAPGLLLDFKELKKIVKEAIIDKFDHGLLLSKEFIKETGPILQSNLYALDVEPSAENLLIYISNMLKDNLPTGIVLTKLKLFETGDSYAEWLAVSE